MEGEEAKATELKCLENPFCRANIYITRSVLGFYGRQSQKGDDKKLESFPFSPVLLDVEEQLERNFNLLRSLKEFSADSPQRSA
jgi:hypothetical protein